VWRADFLPPVEERLAQLVERHDQWSRAQFDLQAGKKSIQVPGQITIPRPGRPTDDSVAAPEPRKVETDSKRIAAWFAAN
jgi:hypothetical protein